MFPNLDAEQARARLSNTDVAEALGLSRISYENKKRTGKFNRAQIVALLSLFDCKFEYLFYTDDVNMAS